jgi:hypothetical protein
MRVLKAPTIRRRATTQAVTTIGLDNPDANHGSSPQRLSPGRHFFDRYQSPILRSVLAVTLGTIWISLDVVSSPTFFLLTLPVFCWRSWDLRSCGRCGRNKKFRFFMTYKGAAGAELYRHAATYIDRIFEVQSPRTVQFQRPPRSIWSSPSRDRPAAQPRGLTPAAVRREGSECLGPAK